MEIADLPALNASLNALATVLLAVGWVCVKRRRIGGHIACMLAATAVSGAFLVSYVVYHAHAGSKHYEGAWPWIYFPILISHVVLAIVNVPLVILTLVRGLRFDFERHKKIARIAFPVWLYVSVTGVVVYAMLYGIGD